MVDSSLGGQNVWKKTATDLQQANGFIGLFSAAGVGQDALNFTLGV